MMNDELPQMTLTGSSNHRQDGFEEGELLIRDIHALQTPPRPNISGLHPRMDTWETSSHLSANSTMSMASDNFRSMSRQFSTLVVAGSVIENDASIDQHLTGNNMLLTMTGGGRNEITDEATNPLAIVQHQQDLSSNTVAVGPAASSPGRYGGQLSMQTVKKEEVESKITAWQNAKVAKIDSRFKREVATIGGWESAQVEKSASKMNKVERKLEGKRARSMEKMQNEIAKARRKAEEKRASSEAKRGTKVAKVFEICKLMRAVGRAPSKRFFF